MKFSVSAAAVAGAVLLTKHAVLAQGVLDTDDSVVTPMDNLVSALLQTNQTEGVPADAYPSEPIQATEVATNTSDAVDAPQRRGLFQPVSLNMGNIARSASQLGKRARDWTTILDGTLPANAKYASAAVQMPAYLTYKVVSNTTDYSVAKSNCLSFCESTPKCASANLFAEWNNPLLDWVFSERSNLKCALYGDIPSLNQFTNKGGQQLKPKPEGLTYITQSSVFANTYPLDNVATPAGYTLSYGPVNAANNADKYMGYRFLTQYDPAACAKVCDSTQGCASFNIWRGVVNGDPRTYTCSMYGSFVDQSTAVNTGDDVNKVKVTYSRGYQSNAAVAAKAAADKAAADKAAADKAAADKAAADQAAADKAAADKAAADKAAAKSKCIADNAGFAWTYLPRTDGANFVCGNNNGADISNLPPFSSATAGGIVKGVNPATSWSQGSDGTFYPFGQSSGVPSAGFTIMTKGYFTAPESNTYLFQLNGDDAARAWFGDKAKSGWNKDNADLTVGCGGRSLTKQLNKGDVIPIRMAGLNGPGRYNLELGVYDWAGNDIDATNAWSQDACDGTNTAFGW